VPKHPDQLPFLRCQVIHHRYPIASAEGYAPTVQKQSVPLLPQSAATGIERLGCALPWPETLTAELLQLTVKLRAPTPIT
jgi:hypothetical protein